VAEATPWPLGVVWPPSMAKSLKKIKKKNHLALGPGCSDHPQGRGHRCNDLDFKTLIEIILNRLKG
jgi:hypothetical protein